MLQRRFQGGMQQRHICPFGPCVLGVLDKYVRRLLVASGEYIVYHWSKSPEARSRLCTLSIQLTEPRTTQEIVKLGLLLQGYTALRLDTPRPKLHSPSQELLYTPSACPHALPGSGLDTREAGRSSGQGDLLFIAWEFLPFPPIPSLQFPLPLLSGICLVFLSSRSTPKCLQSFRRRA
jgi:hypothetical protein